MRIATDMQQLLSGGGEKKQIEEAPLPEVCRETEHYSFLTPEAASMECDLRPDVSQTPPVSLLAPPAALLTGGKHCSVFACREPFFSFIIWHIVPLEGEVVYL